MSSDADANPDAGTNPDANPDAGANPAPNDDAPKTIPGGPNDTEFTNAAVAQVILDEDIKPKDNKARVKRTLVALSAIAKEYDEKSRNEAKKKYIKCNSDEAGNQLEDPPVTQQWKNLHKSLADWNEKKVGSCGLINGKFAFKEGRQSESEKIVLAVEDYYSEFARVYHTFYENDIDGLTLTKKNRRKRVTAVGQEIANNYYINQAIFTKFLKPKPSSTPTVATRSSSASVPTVAIQPTNQMIGRDPPGSRSTVATQLTNQMFGRDPPGSRLAGNGLSDEERNDYESDNESNERESPDFEGNGFGVRRQKSV